MLVSQYICGLKDNSKYDEHFNLLLIPLLIPDSDKINITAGTIELKRAGRGSKTEKERGRCIQGKLI